jgi:hypothetical protein
MSSHSGNFEAIESAMLKWEVIERLQRAIDKQYLRFLETARGYWEQKSAAPDASDACVRIHIASNAAKAPASGAVCSGYFAKRVALPTGKMRSSLA